ncbi:MAG: UDP-N-acetylmuramoyl-L-alanine--D-glutamate ligase [Clostridia bacterium]|nr:UDP-N-acetylmuramoyl-L-alanine--D-glutamate ligase [Clostridia bacterium]
MEYINERLEEFNKFLNGRKVAIIGLGVSNIPLIDYMYKFGAKVTIFHHKEIDDIEKSIMDKITNYSMDFSFGKDCFSKLKGFDIIFRSPSCMPNRPELLQEEENGAILTSEIEMLIKMFPGKIIGVTGSDGKTTTTSLIYEIMKKAGYNCYLGGNIGVPLFTKLNQMIPEDILILELSSFQLMDMDVSPDISVITNITPNHLDIHSSYEEYIEAKRNIFENQDESGTVVLNYDNEITRKLGGLANGKVKFFSKETKLDNGIILDGDIIKKCEDRVRKHILNTNEVDLRGKHNFENICTAIAATEGLVDMNTIIEAVTDFKGVEHRLEFIREINGVKWYNDSIGSSPTRTIAGLNSFNEDIVLIAGGYDKNLDYTPLAKPIVDKVKTLILIGQTSEKIFTAVKEELDIQNKFMDIHFCEDLKQTAILANRYSKPGQVVLFSPASASFDMFKNFMERGEKFKEIVNNI